MSLVLVLINSAEGWFDQKELLVKFIEMLKLAKFLILLEFL